MRLAPEYIVKVDFQREFEIKIGDTTYLIETVSQPDNWVWCQVSRKSSDTPLIPRDQYPKLASQTMGWMLIDLDDETESAFHITYGTSVIDQKWLPTLWEIYKEYREYGDSIEDEVWGTIQATESVIKSLKSERAMLWNKIQELTRDLKEKESRIEIMEALIRKAKASYEISDVDYDDDYLDFDDYYSDDCDLS